MLRPILVLALLAATALAGCADSSPSAPVEDDSTAADKDVKATSTTGVIRGVVVDVSVTPLPGATIKITSLGLETTSLEDGSFGFSQLEPGTYFMEVSKLGYIPTQAQAPVVAGVDKPSVIRVQLEINPSAVPDYFTNKWEGHLRCGVIVPVITFPCSVIRGTEDTVGDYNAEVLTFESLPTFLQGELQWINSQPLGESLFFNFAHCCDNEGFAANGTSQGPSPLVVNAHKAEMEKGAILADGLEMRVFGGAYPGTETGECAPGTPVTNPFCPWGVGVQIEQPFTIYSSYFYNFLPPVGWSYGENGDAVIPS